MVLADTCVWIEWIAGTSLGKRFAGMLGDTDNLLVPTLVQLELYKWCLRELTEDQAEAVIAGTRLARILRLTEAIALNAAELTRSHRLSTADAIIYASARMHEAPLVTLDRHFEGMPGVDYFPKPA